MKDKYSITRKWEAKIAELYKKADFKYAVLAQNEEKKATRNLSYALERVERKKRSYIKKKEEEYRRKCLNEIRELEWKPKKQYKSDAPKIKPIEFAMAIAQENARLRDTDENGNGTCISCSFRGWWSDFAWWHRYSRRFKWICLERENINAQCHTCNYTTWPRGDTVAKEKVNAEYDRKLDLKYWEWTAEWLKNKLVAYMHWKNEDYDLDLLIPQLIEENEKLWEGKNFHAPARRWRATRIKYKNRT